MYHLLMELPLLSSEILTFLPPGQKDLFKQGYHLYAHIGEHMDQFTDYSFVIFPFAKAYEGFLKQIFMDTHLISSDDYKSRHFRVGEVMSPHLSPRLRDRSVYKKITMQVGVELADTIWETWKQGRNEVFHYFPSKHDTITFVDAHRRISMIIATVDKTFELLK